MNFIVLMIQMRDKALITANEIRGTKFIKSTRLTLETEDYKSKILDATLSDYIFSILSTTDIDFVIAMNYTAEEMIPLGLIYNSTPIALQEEQLNATNKRACIACWIEGSNVRITFNDDYQTVLSLEEFKKELQGATLLKTLKAIKDYNEVHVYKNSTDGNLYVGVMYMNSIEYAFTDKQLSLI